MQQMTNRVFPSQEGWMNRLIKIWQNAALPPIKKPSLCMTFVLLHLFPKEIIARFSLAWDWLPFQWMHTSSSSLVVLVHLQQTNRWNAYSISSGTWSKIVILAVFVCRPFTLLWGIILFALPGKPAVSASPTALNLKSSPFLLQLACQRAFSGQSIFSPADRRFSRRASFWCPILDRILSFPLSSPPSCFGAQQICSCRTAPVENAFLLKSPLPVVQQIRR